MFFSKKESDTINAYSLIQFLLTKVYFFSKSTLIFSEIFHTLDTAEILM